MSALPAKPDEPAAERIPRCRTVPQPGQRWSFEIDERERAAWHYGPEYPRPFLYPLLGPSGRPLTRMGHPGDFTHDHHRSIWFAHNQVEGLDFWSENTPCRIEQRQWTAAFDGPDETGLGVILSWFDGHRVELLRQETTLVVRPAPERPAETLIEIQAKLVPSGKEIVLKQTNFGLLGVRVAASLSAHFGGGIITGADGAVGEPALFGKSNRWMDYSGPIANGPDGGAIVEGITLFPHASNPDHPAKWHVRADGWMGPSVCRDRARTLTPDKPLVLRYLLHAHGGPLAAERAHALAGAFDRLPGWILEPAGVPHVRFRLRRA